MQEEGKKSKKKRELASLSDSSQQVPEIIEKIKIPFTVWFSRMEKLGKVKFWQEEPLLVFMRKRGLSDVEDADSYSEALKRF